MKIMLKLLRFLPAILAVAIFTGCDIHELPDVPERPTPAPNPEPEPEPTTRTLRITLSHEDDMTQLGEYFYDNGTLTSRSRADENSDHQVRHVVKAFPATRGETSRSEDASMTFTSDIADGLDATIDITIPSGDHTIIVWTDYVDKGSTDDKYYSTDDFSEVILNNNNAYSGSNNRRDAFYGSATVAEGDDRPVTIEMKLPMARYTFVTTDLRRFIERETAAKDARSFNLDDYTVKFVYPRYVSCSFNLFVGHTADSRIGLTYTSTMRQLSDDEAELGFDYVIVNDAETSVNVGAEIYDKGGKLVARIPAIDVPLKRSRSTVVKGDFLSAVADGPATIDPDFNGSFDIEIK